MKWSLITAVNDDSILESCLLRSPNLRMEIILRKGYRSAAAAYNSGLAQATGEILVFAHQDMYFPEGWIDRARAAVESLRDEPWGVLGVWGVNRRGRGLGHVYCTAGVHSLGHEFEGCQEVRTLDEVVLILNKSSGLRFDEGLPGFHLYGTDLCLEAERQGRKCYAISAFCVHNSDAYGMFPLAFWKACLFLRRKWTAALPITTPCIEITRWCVPMIRWNVVRALNLATGRDRVVGKRVPDPVKLCQELPVAAVPLSCSQQGRN